jgi:hypothetical protein
MNEKHLIMIVNCNKKKNIQIKVKSLHFIEEKCKQNGENLNLFSKNFLLEFDEKNKFKIN